MVAGELATSRAGAPVVAGAAGAPVHDLLLEVAAQPAANAGDRGFDLVEGRGLGRELSFQLAAQFGKHRLDQGVAVRLLGHRDLLGGTRAGPALATPRFAPVAAKSSRLLPETTAHIRNPTPPVG